MPLDEDGQPAELRKVEQYEEELWYLAEHGSWEPGDTYHKGSVRGYDVVQDVTSAMRELELDIETTPGNGRFDLEDDQQEELYESLEDYFD